MTKVPMDESFYKLSYKDIDAMEETKDPRLRSFQALLTKVPVGVYIFWIRSNGMWEFEYVSNRWCEMHQIMREDLLQDASLANSLVHPDELALFLQCNKEALEEKRKFEWEGRFVIAGNVRWFRLESEPVFYENGDSRWYGVAQDITTRVKNEQHLRESEENLRVLNAQKDKFFSIIAHDLKGPFNSVLGVTELLMEEVKANSLENIEVFAKIIVESSKKATDLLENLLEWTRAHTGRVVFSPERFDLSLLFSETFQLFATELQKKDVMLSTSFPVHLEIDADRQMIATVLRNLLSNALKYSLPKGHIEVFAENRAFDILVIIKDTGVGIPSDRLHKLFHIDNNFSTLGTANEKGTGLGLLLCKEFVERHAGEILVESKVGVGSSFTFTISQHVDKIL